MQEYDLTTMKRVLTEEANAIYTLVSSLDNQFVQLTQLIDWCEMCEGKIVLTGMGKSGYIARKISATLASLGTSSFFLHPAEAAHGNLGMIQAKDMVLMISKSGETYEIIQLINSLKIIDCRLVGIFCEENSTLQEYCDLTIVLPLQKEACINNLAPTTSTTLTMAFGDALAIELAERKQFSKQQFALFHPQGTLGKKLLLSLGNIACKELDKIAVDVDETVESALWLITKNRLGAVAVVDKNEKLLGLISDGDIRRNLKDSKTLINKKVSEIMTNAPISGFDSTLAIDAFKLMHEKKISVLPVITKQSILIGMVSLYDIIDSGIAGGLQ